MDVSRERQHERQELFERLEAVDDVKPFYNDEQAAALACTETHLVGHCEDGFVSCHGLDRTETFLEIETQGCADCIVEVEPEALRVAIAAVDGEPCCFFSSICEAVEPVRKSGCLAIACRSVEEREALASRAVEQVHNALSWLAPETLRRWHGFGNNGDVVCREMTCSALHCPSLCGTFFVLARRLVAGCTMPMLGKPAYLRLTDML